MCTEGEIAGLKFGMHGSDVKSVVIPAGGEEAVTPPDPAALESSLDDTAIIRNFGLLPGNTQVPKGDANVEKGS